MTKKDLAAYEHIDAQNWSVLKHARTSMLAYRHAVENPTDDTPRFGLGRAIHTAILEPAKLQEEYAVFDGDRRAGKAWDAFFEEHGDKTILKRSEWEVVQTIADRVAVHPL